jgi:hypothetical protein
MRLRLGAVNWSFLRSSNLKDNFAKVLAALHHPMGLGGIRKRKCLVKGRAQLPSRQGVAEAGQERRYDFGLFGDRAGAECRTIDA